MTRLLHRRPAAALLGAVALLALTACSGQEYPNSTFTHLSDLNTDINNLWDRLYLLAMIVFVVVEALLLFTIFRFRAKPNAPLPKQIHGSHLLEMVWTAIPVLILIPLAIPTVKTIFKTQADAPAGSLQVEVYGHQWWWEFRYPQYGVTTANELYLPAGRTVNFTLRTQDVLHSFWTPQLAGKRDLISNKTNHIWYTPDAKLVEDAFNGFCTEYCGASHANMRFRVYTASPENFEKWAAHQKNPATGSPAATAAQATADSAAKKAPKAAAVVAPPAPAPAAGSAAQAPAMPSAAPALPPAAATPVNFTWKAPEGWVEAPGNSQMRVVTYRFGANGEGECYIASLPGQAGGRLENFNRWLAQMGEPPLKETELELQPPVLMFDEELPMLITKDRKSTRLNSSHRT